MLNSAGKGLVRGGGGGGGGSNTCRPKGSAVCTILRYPFWVTDPKIFLKAPSGPIYTNFEYITRFFFVKIFQKVPKNAFFGLFFFKPKQGLFSALESSKNQFGRPKKS